MTKEIPLTQEQSATVCDCHAHLVENHKWYANWNHHRNSFYAARRASVLERLSGAPRKIYMHAVINGTPKGFHTDHKNCNTLDNQCVNLRTATVSQNNRNSRKRDDNTSGYKGVSWYTQNRKWRATIKLDSKRTHLGYFDNPKDAARAYDKAARELHGEFAVTNGAEK